MENQEWFWSKEWQKGEREADKQIKEGRVSEKMNAEEAMAHLDKMIQGGETNENQ